MRSCSGSPRSGFTLPEVVITSSIMVIAVALAVSGLVHLLRMAQQSGNQNELDVQAQVATERLKADLRLSALDQMYFYPQGSNSYTAVSFPIARDDNGDGAVERDANGNIIWDQTAVYHMWNGPAGYELRLTVFDPRDNTLSSQQRQDQLNSVVQAGNGSTAYGGNRAATRTLFRNVFSWKLTPHGALYDGYNGSLELDKDVNLGFATLAAGLHTVTFKVVGKSDRSSGYNIGLDTLLISPSYGSREAEEQLPATAYGGAAPVDLYQPGGSFSGSRQLLLPATAVGDFVTLTLNNDQWEESNFDNPEAVLSNTVAEVDETLNPTNGVVRLEGADDTWAADDATGDTAGRSADADVINGCAVRVLLRGNQMEDGGDLQTGGGRCRVNFRAAAGHKLFINDAFIMLSKDPMLATPDADGGGQRIRFGGLESVTLNNGAEVWSDWVNMPIDREQSYLIAFMVNKGKSMGASNGTSWLWEEPTPATNGSCWVWVASDTPGDGELTTSTWSDKGAKVYRTNTLFAVQTVGVSYQPIGTFESQVYDTRLLAPMYNQFTWHAVKPGGCVLNMRARCGSDPAMSDAPEWTAVAAKTAPGALSLAARRYVQFQAELRSDGTSLLTPKLLDVCIRWSGETAVVDVGGTFVKSPTNGIFEVFIDNQSLLTGFTMDLDIFKTSWTPRGTRTLTTHATSEVKPLNTRK